MPYAAARVVEKVLVSAISNAKENDKQNPGELKITKAYVDQSSTLRRWRAMSRGRGYPILKRTSHVTIEVNPDGSVGVKSPKISTTAKKEVHKHDHTHDHDHSHDHGHKHKAKPVKQVKLKETKEKTKETKKKKDKKEKEE